MSNRLFDITGRVGLVTGGRRGLGLAFSEGLAACGARIACADIADEYDELRTRVQSLGSELACFKADLAERSQRTGLVDRVLERFGRLDILVNCAGIQHRQPAPGALGRLRGERMGADPPRTQPGGLESAAVCQPLQHLIE